ncbi:MAG: glycosyltransferase family 39 protein [Lachnospiraceae bacterium]|nr:glycosyltransferase family 39 protein [Lachnospiraceae bacterium]
MGDKMLGVQKKTPDVERIAGVAFCILCGIVMAGLFAGSMRYSWVNELFWEEMVTEQRDSLLYNLVGMTAGVGILGAAAAFAARLKDRRKMDRLAVVTGLICVFVSAYWIYTSQTMPQADQSDLVVYAEAYAKGDTSSLQKGGYVANYPQQLGMITFLRGLFGIFGQGNYKAYQYFNACMVFMIVFCGYRIVGYLTDRNVRAEAMFLLLVLCCIPMYGYTSLVYGEIASVALLLLSCCLLLSCLERFKWQKLLLLAVACGGMIQFRENTLIGVVAFLIVLAVKLAGCLTERVTDQAAGRAEKIQTERLSARKMSKRREGFALLGIGGSIVAGVLAIQLAVSAVYAPYIPEDAKPIPALLFVAMGTHYSPETGAGWHDGYEVQTFLACDCDPETALEIGKQEIRDFWAKCKADPAQFFLFYRLKINSQWNAPLYQCIVMDNAFYGAPVGIARAICFLGGDRYLERFMEIYQLLVYGGALLFVVVHGRKAHGRKAYGIEDHALMICIYGGFLFSLIWEAKTRYVFPYFMMMIPCAAAGLTEGFEIVCDRWKMWRKSN